MDLLQPINQPTTATASTATAAAAAPPLIPPVSIQPRPPISIQPRPATVHPIAGQLDIGPITTVHPIAQQLDHGPITTVRHIMEQLDFGSMDVPYNFCAALHWINKRVTISPARNPRFEACCKYSNINLPLF